MDHLIGLKENVIIGKLIPAGTGMKCYRNIRLDSDKEEIPEEEELFLEEDLELEENSEKVTDELSQEGAEEEAPDENFDDKIFDEEISTEEFSNEELTEDGTENGSDAFDGLEEPEK